jgi:hypothetical protein
VLVCVIQKPHLLTAGYVQVMCRFSDAGSRQTTERLRQVPILAGNSEASAGAVTAHDPALNSTRCTSDTAATISKGWTVRIE